MCFVNILIQIALQNTDFGVPQKSSKHFLISIFFPCPTPRSVLRASNNEDLFCLQFCSYKCVLSIFIYNIALQNTDFGVLQKSSKHFLISIFFQMGRGDTPLPDPPPARHFVPRTTASPLSMTIHAPLPPNPGTATVSHTNVVKYKGAQPCKYLLLISNWDAR